MGDLITGNADTSSVEVQETAPDVIGAVETSTEDVEYVDTATDNTISDDQVSAIEETAQPEDSSVKDDPQRIAYWQSKADTATNEADSIKDQLSFYKDTLGPIKQLIDENPQVLDRLEQTFSNRVPSGSQQRNQTNSMKEPTPPQRPATYNEVDAYNDPDSESFKFRMAKEQFSDDMMVHLVRSDQQRNQAFQQQMQQQQQTAVVRNAFDHVKSSYGYDNHKAQDFVQWAQNPNNVDMEVLVKVYEATHSPNQEQTRIQDRATEMRAQNERLKIPRTTTVETGETASPLSDEDVFNAGLLAHRRR